MWKKLRYTFDVPHKLMKNSSFLAKFFILHIFWHDHIQLCSPKVKLINHHSHCPFTKKAQKQQKKIFQRHFELLVLPLICGWMYVDIWKLYFFYVKRYDIQSSTARHAQILLDFFPFILTFFLFYFNSFTSLSDKSCVAHIFYDPW